MTSLRRQFNVTDEEMDKISKFIHESLTGAFQERGGEVIRNAVESGFAGIHVENLNLLTDSFNIQYVFAVGINSILKFLESIRQIPAIGKTDDGGS